MNHKQLMQQMAEMKAEMDTQKAEMQNLRQQVEAYQDVEASVMPASAAPTSRRRMLKRFAGGIAGLGAVAALGGLGGANREALAMVAGADDAIEAIGGTSGSLGYGLVAGGGKGALKLMSTTGALPTGEKGAMFVNDDGDLYYNGGTGWRKLGGNSTSGALHLLDSPLAIANTSLATGTPLNPQAAATRLTPHNNTAADAKAKKRTFQATGAGGVPAGAKGILVTFNLFGADAQPPNTTGRTTLWNDGPNIPLAAGDQTTGIPANSVVYQGNLPLSNATTTVALSADGKFAITCSLAIHVAAFVVGYYL